LSFHENEKDLKLSTNQFFIFAMQQGPSAISILSKAANFVARKHIAAMSTIRETLNLYMRACLLSNYRHFMPGTENCCLASELSAKLQDQCGSTRDIFLN